MLLGMKDVLTEFISKCRHKNKLLLKNVKDSMD